ncbi:MAG TPA: hypothetical protein VGF34_14755 [Stellaceae bacterium]
MQDEESYQLQLRKLQIAMLQLQQIYRAEGRRGIVALEGWDAAGKDGAIRRMTEKLDLRWLRVCPIGKPSPDAGTAAFWSSGSKAMPPRTNGSAPTMKSTASRSCSSLPPPGHLAIFDRSDDGVRLVKLFLHISAEEQLRRFAERIAIPIKRWKINTEDFRNRAPRGLSRSARRHVRPHLPPRPRAGTSCPATTNGSLASQSPRPW